MRRVVHLMPYDGIGGVERAAATAHGARRDDVTLESMFIFDDVRDRSRRNSTFDPRAFWSAAGRIARLKPDLVILSLWRAVIVGGLARLRGCRAPMVLFLHNARDAHALDRILTRAATRRVSAIWADSATTLVERLAEPPAVPVRVISYMLDQPEPVRHARPDPMPHLIFWGRLAAQKDPLRMLALFAQLHSARPEATLIVIGPDGGMEEALRAEIALRGLSSAVTLTGPLAREAIGPLASRASFYLQTSRYEGMALSVMEAMQAGLVPVVTPVGEIARYTHDGQDSIWIPQGGEEADTQTVARIIACLDEPEAWRALRAAAIGALKDRPLYSEDVLSAAVETLKACTVGKAGE